MSQRMFKKKNQFSVDAALKSNAKFEALYAKAQTTILPNLKPVQVSYLSETFLDYT